MKVAVAFDHRGVKLREQVIEELEALRHDVIDLGTDTDAERIDYPDKARELGEAIQRGEIAFIRRDRGFDQLRIGNTTSGTSGSRFLVKKPTILSTELGITHVAYVEKSGNTRSVHVRNIGTGRDGVVYRATSGGLNFAGITKPAYDSELNGFMWARTNLGSGTGNRLVRYQLRGSKLTYAQGSPRYNSTSWAGDQVGAATSSSLDGSDSPVWVPS